jgi:hypothetical protein
MIPLMILFGAAALIGAGLLFYAQRGQKRKRQILNTGSGALLNIPLFGHSIIAGYMI